MYPFPLYDRLTYHKVNNTYKIVYLENDYVRLAVVPELGGRLFGGIDKTNNYQFHLPAARHQTGAHRPDQGLNFRRRRMEHSPSPPRHNRAAGSIPNRKLPGRRHDRLGRRAEIRHRMRWAVGYTLHPGRAHLKAKLRILNRTPLVQTMLCWANVAVRLNENYQIIFPPRTQWETHHHKREFVQWLIARGRYGGAHFSRHVDVSWYKNHVASYSIFACNYEDDFLAGYDHGKCAGIISVADYHIVAGKKL